MLCTGSLVAPTIRDRSFFMSMGGLVGFRGGGGHEKKMALKGGGGYQKKMSERGGGGHQK